MIRRICVITGSRAEYGHLRTLIQLISEDRMCGLQILVTGMHLEVRFGETWQEIAADGYRIDAKVEMAETDDTPLGVAQSMSYGLTGMTQALSQLKPDVTVILGDRFEMMVAAQSAMLNRIPIAHIHGGEATEGLLDEAVRHSITKMAHLHFAAAAPYAQRIIQLGEHPTRVFNVGAPGLCILERAQLLDRATLQRALNITFRKRLFIVTYHPVTLSTETPVSAVEAMLSAIDLFPETTLIITGVNADAGNEAIEMAYREFARQRPDRVHIATSLGQTKYLSALRLADVCIGNSSSGIIEAPALGVPTINIGPRQRGRLRAASVIDCDAVKSDIVHGINRALDPDFKNHASQTRSPYGSGGASKRIKQTLVSADLNDILMKRFHDISESA